MSKIVALLTDITSEGSVVLTQQTGAKLNGMPIATKGCKITYKGSPTDQPVEFASGVLLNGQPLTFVGAKTSAGTAIISTGKTTATIGQVKKEQPSVLQQEPLEQKQRKIVLKSTYPYDELYKISQEFAEGSFTLLLTSFFEKDIEWAAYRDLYLQFRNKKLLMPPIVVVEEHLKGNKYAAFNSDTESIEIRRSCVIQAVEGNKNKRENAKQLLLLALLEEYGHYIDHYLRNHCSKVGGDAKKDEGAVFSYYLTNYWITDKKIDFGTIEIDGVVTPLSIDFTSIIQNYNDIKDRIEKDIKDGKREFFSSGEKNSEKSRFGHFDFIKVLEEEKILNKYAICWIYLGNYLRDMSQVITPTINALKQEHIDCINAAHPDILKNKPEFLSPVLLSRDNWTKIIEIMAAKLFMDEMNSDTAEGGYAKGYEAILNKDFVAKSDNNVQKLKKELKKKYNLKTEDIPHQYLNFVKYFDFITPSLLGVSRSEEHIDNPIGTITFDEISEDLYYCPTKARPSLTDFYGMKRYIRNETNEIEKNTDDKIQGAVIKAKNEKGRYVQGLPTAVATMKNFFRTGVSKFKNKKLTPKQRLLGLTDIGAALHILEDYFAHSNFCEVLLIKLGVNVYSWTDYTDPELQNYDSNGRFEVKNCIPPKKLNRKYEGAYLEKDTYFQDVMELYKHLNTQATCILLPSFEVEGFYFLYKPQGKERFELYFASNETKKLDEVELVGYREINTEKLKDISSSIPKIVHIPAEESVIEDIKSTSPTKTEVNSTQISATYVSSEDPFEKCIPERKEQILSYKGLTCYLVEKQNFSDPYNTAKSIPIVTGFFGVDDALHSMIHLLSERESYEEKETNYQGSEKEVKKNKADKKKEEFNAQYMAINEFIELFIIDSLIKTQSKNGAISPKQNSTYRELLELFAFFVKERNALNRFMYEMKKKAREYLEPAIDFFEPGVTAVKTVATMGKNVFKNFINKKIREAINFNAEFIVACQNSHIEKLGTNPTHSQLAKDDSYHPLHSLAGTLARYCIAEMREIFRALASAENKYRTKDGNEIVVTSEDIAEMLIEKAVSFMQHPCQTNWADAIALEWLTATPDHLIKLHEHEYLFHNSVYLAKDIKKKMKQLQKLLNQAKEIDFQKELEELCLAVRQFIKEVDFFVKNIDKEGDREIKELKQKIEQSEEELCKYLQKLKEKPPISKKLKQDIKHQCERKCKELQSYIDKLLEHLKPHTHSHDFSPTLQGQQKSFAQSKIEASYQEKEQMSDFTQKMVAYWQSTNDKQYAYAGALESYKTILKNEEKYIAQNAEYYINRVNRRRNNHSFLVEPDKRNA